MKNRKVKLLTLCLIHQHPRVLLGMKKKGLGVGKWNGFGGKVEKGEDIENAARREVLEEAGITVTDTEKVGIIEFDLPGADEVHEVHVFRATEFSGEPIETDEMRPQWFDVSEIPFDKMWPDDKYWLPLLLTRKKFKGRYVLGKDDKILEMNLNEVKEI